MTDDRSDGGAEQAGHEAFYEELVQHARPRRAQRGSHGQLGRPLDVPRQHEEREIRAHDHEQDRYGNEQAGQNRLRVAEQCVAQRHGDGRAPRQRLGVFARQLRRHGRKLGSGG